jgi:catechol 2,3-dioxygenase-like lactoylglutathione lyase family enzyme
MTQIRVLVGTTDFARSTSFYGSALGFPVDEHWDDPDGRGTLFRAATGGVIEVVEDSPHHPAEPASGVKVAIEVDDVDLLHERVRAAGVEVVEPIGDRPWGHRNFEIRDPNGLGLVFFTAIGSTGHAPEAR